MNSVNEEGKTDLEINVLLVSHLEGGMGWSRPKPQPATEFIGFVTHGCYKVQVRKLLRSGQTT